MMILIRKEEMGIAFEVGEQKDWLVDKWIKNK
jgi:hypothetical protein